MADFDEIFQQMKTGAEKLGKGVSDIAKFTVSRVESKTKDAKIRYGIHGAEERKKANFEAIGEAMYKAYKSDAEPEDFSGMYEIIDALEEEIAELKLQLGEN